MPKGAARPPAIAVRFKARERAFACLDGIAGPARDESRIAKALLNLMRSVGEHGASGRPLGIHLSQHELGNIVGSSRESVNRQLQLWHRAGLVELAKGTIVIRDQTALERLI